MFLVIRTVFLLHLLAGSLALQDHCCTMKKVGGITYSLLPSGAFNGEVPTRCLNDCVYRDATDTAPRDSYRKFCFAAGDLPTECLSDSWTTHPTHRPWPTAQPTHDPWTTAQSTHGPWTTVQPTHGPWTTTQSSHGPWTTQTGTCKCGIKKTRRIIGGTETEVNEYPWILAFDFSGTSGTIPNSEDKSGRCGATLIAKNWAVTASHCVALETKHNMSLVLGLHDRSDPTETNRQVLTIDEIVLHPNYAFGKYPNDIALLKLTQSVDLDAWSPACLPTSGADFTGQNGWVYGWGVTAEYGYGIWPDMLLDVEVPIVSDSDCATALGSDITPDMLCAGGEKGKDSCGGDSGGPLTVADSTSGAHTLVGVVSWGPGCANEGLYGVYADVPYFRTWIDETIAAKGGATFCEK